MLERVLRHIRTFFQHIDQTAEEIIATGVEVSDGQAYKPGQYVYICGSVLNDGVYQITAIAGDVLEMTGLTPEDTDDVTVYGLAIPPSLLTVVAEIESYVAKNPDGVQSESLGDYSVSYSGGAGGTSWEGAFAGRLSQWRRVHGDIPQCRR